MARRSTVPNPATLGWLTADCGKEFCHVLAAVTGPRNTVFYSDQKEGDGRAGACVALLPTTG